MTISISPRGTFDDERSQRRPCPCNRHTVTGHWTRLYCPFAAPLTPGRWGVIWAEGGEA